MQRYCGHIPGHWHQVEIPNSWEAAQATQWAAELNSTGKFMLITKESTKTLNLIVDCFYFSQEKDAVLFALKWAA